MLDHIDAHLDEGDLSVARLARVAALSPHHFHRQFTALYGLTVARYVRLVRLRRAAYLLGAQRTPSILDVALGAGYGSHEAFTRAFERCFGQTPSAFRAAPEWSSWADIDRTLTALRSEPMTRQTPFHADDVEVVDFPATRLVAVEHRGSERQILASVRRFVAWRQARGLSPAKSATFNVFRNDPEADGGVHHVDLGVATHLPADPGDGVVEALIPAGRCARLRLVGGDARLGAAFAFLYGEWLPASGEAAGTFPPFAQRVAFYPAVPEHEAITDLFVPLG